jgi:RecG-like helicase
VLDDLNAGRPMDRLVCGDVGFGKTEVARDEARELRDVDRQALKPFGKRAKMLAGE